MPVCFLRLVVTASGFLMLAACTSFEVEPAHLFSIEVPATGQVGQPVQVKVNGGLNDSCWAFDSISLEQGESDRQYIVHAFERAQGNSFETCEEIPGAFEKTASFVPTATGDYEVIAPDMPASYTVVVSTGTPTASAASTL